MLRDVLLQQGWEVLEAANGQHTLQVVAQERPAVLLMAREMADLDGLSVLDALRADPSTRDMPVVFVTGHTRAEELAETLERGAHDYVRKPVDPIELVARVRTALRLSALHSELAERNAELELLARTDVLTGLANRRNADELLRQLIAGARRHQRELCAVLIDVDHFKRVNDRHGHGAGDTVLSVIAQRVATVLREEDTAARWGGEEFLVLLPDADDAAIVCQRMREALANAPIEVSGASLVVTASFGWAHWRPGESPDALLGRADAALYAAKAAGRDRAIGFDELPVG